MSIINFKIPSVTGRHLGFLNKALNNLNFLFKLTEQLKINNLTKKYQTLLRFERIIIFRKERQIPLITIIALRLVKIFSSVFT